MDVQSGDVAEEIKRLQRCVNDLVSLLALPAMWSGAEPSQIVDTLLDALLRMLQLDFVYVRLRDSGGQAPIEMARFAPSQEQTGQPQEIGEVLKKWLGADPQGWPRLIRNPTGGRDISIMPLGLGLHGEIGEIVAGSERADFPRQTERLILSVAANQASIGLQGARLLSEQKHVSSELDRRVAQRTAELAAANEELRAEIAERKGIEERLLKGEALLKNSEARLRQVIDALPTLVWCNLPDGPNEFLNKGWHEYTGLSHEESHGWGWQVAFHPDDLPPLLKRWQELLLSGEPGEIEARLRRHDGAFRWFLIRVSPYRDEAGKIVRWYGTSTDIHDRKRAEDGLKRSEARYRVVVETASDAVISMDEGGVIIFANAATKRIFDYEPAEVIGKPLTVLMPESMRKLHETGYKRYLATGKRHLNWQGIQVTAQRKDGQEFPAEVSFGEMTIDGHKIFTGFIRDISEKKNAEEALRNAQAQLSRAIQTATVGEFAAAIAHEVNQPLAAVVTNGQACLRWLAAQPPGTAKAQEAAERIVRDGKEAGEVVRRIRALFRQAAVERIELDLNEIIHEVLHLLNAEATRRRVAVETDLGQDLAPVMGDRVQLQQVVFNLLLNGIEAMDSVVDRPRKLFICSKRPSPETVLVEVRDSGAGLKDPDRIFEAFFTTKDNGMGMGLAICRSIIDAHHGRLWAASGEGVGATFSFTLPVRA